jgi:hypothetical protein
MPTTSNYGWNTPTVGGDEDTWGDELNATIQAIDTQVVKAGQQLLSSGVISSPAPSLDIPLPAWNVPGTSAPWRRLKLLAQEIEPLNSGVNLQALIAFDAGPNYETADYRYSGSGTVDGVASQFSSISMSYIALHAGAFASIGGLNPGLDMDIAVPSVSGHYTILDWSINFHDASAGRDAKFIGRGRCAGVSPRPTYLRLKFSSGNIAQARWALFGVVGV